MTELAVPPIYQVVPRTTARSIRPDQLTARQLETWDQLQTTSPELGSPLFAPTYFQILGAVLPEITIAELRQGDEVVGFFPFQRIGGRVGRPAGLWLSDFQGLIAPPDLRLDCKALMDDLGLAVCHFDRLLMLHAGFHQFRGCVAESPVIDLSCGFEAYLAERRAAGASWVSQVARKSRKLSREVGELRFEFATCDRQVFQQLKAWKSLQRRRTQSHDVLRLDWVCDVLDRVFAASEPGFTGVLSALYAGSRLVAAHFGVRSKDTLHLWFPSYDVALDRYSPGLIMFSELFRAAAEAGIQRIDLGKGRERFKRGFMTGSLMLAEGCIDVRPVRRWFSGAWYASRACVRNSPLHGLIQGPKRKLRRAIRWWSEGGS